METKKGETCEAVTEPLYPITQEQPSATEGPALLTGQGTALQVLAKKGDCCVADTVPLNPALQAQPATTLVPELLVGQATGVQL